jgi:hypothetical protein
MGAIRVEERSITYSAVAKLKIMMELESFTLSQFPITVAYCNHSSEKIVK